MDDHQRQDVWAKLEPWYERTRFAYYLIGVGSAIVFAAVYLVRNVVIPNWEYAKCLSVTAFLICVFIIHSKTPARPAIVARRPFFYFVFGGPAIFAFVSAKIIAFLTEPPPADVVNAWRSCLALAMVFTAYSLTWLSLTVGLDLVLELLRVEKRTVESEGKLLGHQGRLIDNAERQIDQLRTVLAKLDALDALVKKLTERVDRLDDGSSDGKPCD